ncbi:MAG: NADH-ubiquinone oxidoreductase-F iron-sulfur binding region domain-containing protein [Bacteroidales bacterium]|jgi:NADH:ubiquinone oxidoreductase subunit F (NADH-binding)
METSGILSEQHEPLLRLITHDQPDSDASLKLLGKTLRRERVEKLTVFIDKTTPSSIYSTELIAEAVCQWSEQSKIPFELVETGCLGLISAEPSVGIQAPGRARLYYGPVEPSDIGSLLDAITRQVIPEENLIGQMILGNQQPWENIADWMSHPFFNHQVRTVTHLNGIIDPGSIGDYIAWGGYRTFYKSIRYYSDKELLKLIEESGLRGRSGSGFPAAQKWAKAAGTTSDKRYVLCNADESDPGGYMHRVLIESNPHLIIEGIMLAAYIIGANHAIIYTRSRYRIAVKRIQRALNQVRALGLIGEDILHSGFTLDIQLKRGPGAFVCGEETALIASLEGKRGSPRTKPPYPATSGLFGKPTLVHNIETLAQVPVIIEKGPEWYRKTGTTGSTGTKLFSLSGKVKRLGVVEVPFGTRLGEVIDGMGGGTRNGKPAKAVLLGGPSGQFVPLSKFEITLDLDRFQENKMVMGSGSMVLLDGESCPINLIKNMMDFIRQESCGKCIPCRDGSKRIKEILSLISSRSPTENKYEALDRFKGVTGILELAEVMQSTSLCGLGKSAPNPLISGMQLFKEELEEHVFDRTCRAGVCLNMRSFTVDPVACNGCNLCYVKCPEKAIIGSARQVHYIVENLCTGCGKCFEVCKFNAILVN